jgi:hydrocephalus-inducing protein
LIKDNPNAVVLPIQCLGAKPSVAVSHDTVMFERALLGKTLTKTLTLTNTCPLKVNWKLNKIDALPSEFSVKPTSGTLLPFKEEGIDITFNSISQKKFLEQITLEVEDVEGLGIKQEDKNIALDAEAFNITLNEAMQIEQVLDFEAVRVGEPKELPLLLKNQGQYPIKYDFTVRKKAQEIFTIEPMVGRLLKDEEINIVVKFLTMKEIKMKTNKQNAEIFLNILEGDQNEKHQQIPILVNVNAVYSKYSLAPLKNLNFGPM